MSEASKAGWRARADETFLAGMPTRPRIALEVALLFVLVFGGTLAATSLVLAIALLAVALTLGLGLVRPWARIHGGVPMRVAATGIVVFAVVAPSLVDHEGLSGTPRMLGVRLDRDEVRAGDPPGVAGGVVLVRRVEPRSPADGVLQVGDRIVSLGDAPIDRDDPVADVTRRTHGDDLPEDTTVTVLRDGRATDLAVHIPRVRGPRRDYGRVVNALREHVSHHLIVATAVRGALVIALLLLLVRADGQRLAAIGIAREGALRELLASLWMTAGTFAVQLSVAIPIGIVGLATGIASQEASQRSQALGMMAGQGSLLGLLPALLVAAAFEEVAFRGFLLPRARALTGSWIAAVVAVSVAFGLGHVYEGALAVAQTAFLGVYFAALTLLRRRLLGPIVAHATFNAIMLALVQLLQASGAFEKLKELAPH